jgi:RNA polymerase sigma-70 factor, ECF subfamily
MRPLEDRSSEPDIYRDRFERCFDQHYVRIFAFAARRVSGREGAEDVVADTFAIAWRRRDRIPEEPLPWLYAIAANVIANQYRSSHRRHNLDERLARGASVAAPGIDPADSLGGRDELAAAMARLEEAEREVLRLVAW